MTAIKLPENSPYADVSWAVFFAEAAANGADYEYTDAFEQNPMVRAAIDAAIDAANTSDRLDIPNYFGGRDYLISELACKVLADFDETFCELAEFTCYGDAEEEVCTAIESEAAGYLADLIEATLSDLGYNCDDYESEQDEADAEELATALETLQKIYGV